MKKFNTKNIFAAALAVTMMAIPCGTAYADSNVDTFVAISETAELTNIGGYACYERDGNFWTLIDGEEYLVIDTRDWAIGSDTSMTTYSQNASVGAPTNWGNMTYVPLPDGTSYTDSVDLSKGNYYSPIYETTPSRDEFKFKFDTNHVLNHTYNMTFWYHFESTDEWHPEPVTITFNGIPGFKIIHPGTLVNVIDAMGVEIDADSTGRNDFKYTITVRKY